jgi:hypothetical protein
MLGDVLRSPLTDGPFGGTADLVAWAEKISKVGAKRRRWHYAVTKGALSVFTCRCVGARRSCVTPVGEHRVYDAVDGATPCCAVIVREFRRWRIDPV